MNSPAKPDWIAVDWGTSNLRVWAMLNSGVVLAKRQSESGMQGLTPAEFEPALLALVDDWLAPAKATQIMCCGMVGSHQGWAEAGYQSVPCKLTALGSLTVAKTEDPRIHVQILPGIKQMHPADVMRGEETQIAGLLAQSPEFEGVVCLPGTHSKWVRVKNQKVLKFTTFMTGELFSLLSVHSVLRHFLPVRGWDNDAFSEALAQAIEFPNCAAAQLFTLRAESLIGDLKPAAARARLSGLLIGLEIGAARDIWQGRKLVILGSDSLAGLYRSALLNLGQDSECYDIERLTLAGLSTVYRHLEFSA